MRPFCRKFLEELPPLNYNVFVYVLSFMREVLSELNYNRYVHVLFIHDLYSLITGISFDDSFFT